MVQYVTVFGAENSAHHLGIVLGAEGPYLLVQGFGGRRPRTKNNCFLLQRHKFMYIFKAIGGREPKPINFGWFRERCGQIL